MLPCSEVFNIIISAEFENPPKRTSPRLNAIPVMEGDRDVPMIPTLNGTTPSRKREREAEINPVSINRTPPLTPACNAPSHSGTAYMILECAPADNYIRCGCVGAAASFVDPTDYSSMQRC